MPSVPIPGSDGTRRPLARPRGATAALCLAALFFVLAPPAPRAFALEASPGAAPEVREAYDRVATELLCYCGCARQTVKECTCSVAHDLRSEWERRIASGESAETLIAEYIDQHGEQSRNAPPRKGLNLIAWFGPGIAIVLATGLTLLLIRVWAARGRRASPAGSGLTGVAQGAAGAADAPLRERLERDLREFE